jgi:outer membrane cobalamin receptor
MKILFKIIVFFISIFVFGENTSISGFVREKDTGEPISYANVFLSDNSLGTATNQDGYFVIPNITPGNYKLNASMIGYSIFQKDIIIEENSSLRLEIILDNKVIEGSEVVVTAERQKFERTIESSQISLDLREINAAPAFIEPDVFRTLQMLPGVQTSSDLSSALYVRGSTPDQNLIMLDGIAIYNPFHLFGIFSTFNTDAIKEADFHAGGFPAKYGGRMGAILNVVNREGNIQEVRGSADISFISTKGLLEGPIPTFKGLKGSWMISGRRTWLDQLIDKLKIPNGSKKSDGTDQYYYFPYSFYDYQIKINFDLNPFHRLTYSRFYGDDVVRFSYSEDTQNQSGNTTITNENKFGIEWPWGNKTNGLTWRWIYSPTVVAKTFFSNSRYRFDFDISIMDSTTYDYPDSTSKYFQDIGYNIFDIISDNTIETEIIWKANEDHEISGGFQNRNINFDLGINFDFTDQDTSLVFNPLSLKNKTRETSLFLQDKWKVSKKFNIQSGIRTTKYSLHNKIYVDPRLGIKYGFSDNMAFKFNWGVYHQFLTTATNQDENLRIVELWLGIPKDKKASVSQHLIGGFEYLTNKNIFLRIEAYNKTFDNLLTLKESALDTEDNDENGLDSVESINEFWDTEGISQGIELLIKKSSGRLNGWVGYTYSKTKYDNEISGEHYPGFDRTHTLNIVGNFMLTENLQLSSSITQMSGNPYTEIIGRVTEWNQSIANESQWFPYDKYLVGQKNSARYDDYFRLDMGITRKGGNLFGVEYDTNIQIMNLTRHFNILTYQYRIDRDFVSGDQLGVQRRAVSMFPLIITLGVKIVF